MKFVTYTFVVCLIFQIPLVIIVTTIQEKSFFLNKMLVQPGNHPITCSAFTIQISVINVFVSFLNKNINFVASLTKYIFNMRSNDMS